MHIRIYHLAVLLFVLILACTGQAVYAGIFEEVLLYARADSTALPDAENVHKEIVKQMDTTGRGIPVVVFNPSGWTRTDIVDMQSPFPGENLSISLYDDKGNVVRGQTMGDRLYFTATGVPAMGFKVYMARRTAVKSKPEVSGKGFILENQYLSVGVNQKDGNISKVWDKKAKRNIMPVGAAWAVPQVLDARGGISKLVGNTETVLMESGPVKARITFDHYYRDSQINQDVIVYDGLQRMDLLLTVDWQEIKNKDSEQSQLRFAFPLFSDFKEYTTQYPGGYEFDSIEKSDTSSERWIELSGMESNMAVCADFPVKFEVLDNVLYATVPPESLLSSSADAADAPELLLSFFPAKADFRPLSLYRLSEQIANPLKGIQAGVQKGVPGKTRSFVYLSDPRTIITKAKYDGYLDSLEITVKNTSDAVVDSSLVSSCRFNSYTISPDPTKLQSQGSRIRFSVDPRSEKQIVIYK